MKKNKDTLRSRQWFDNPDDPGMTALYLERYLNFGFTAEELQSGRPIIGIAQTGSDLSPCNRHHIILADRVSDGIRDAGGIPIEFPVHPIQETGRRPTAALDRNLQCISLTEVLHGYPIDGVVLTTGCDKTTPAMLMGAASVNMPSIALSVGPMLNGNYLGRCVGAGTIIWEARRKYAQGEIDYAEFMDMAAGSAPSAGHCNTMGTALTMNSLVEALGMMLPGTASIPAPYRERQQAAYKTGKRIVDMVWENLKPTDIMTKAAFENAIKVTAAIGGSTNAPIHINAIAAHAGVDVSMDDWRRAGADVPQIVNCQPVGEYLSEEYHRAGGVPAVMAALLTAGIIEGDAQTVSGSCVRKNLENVSTQDERVIRPVTNPVAERAGFIVMSGNFFDSAIMKASAITDTFRARYLQNPDKPDVFEAKVVIFEGPEDYHHRIDDPSLGIDANTILVMRGVGPKGYPGSAEVVNMQPPSQLMNLGITELPTMGDGRQSGTSGAPSILNMSPESASGGGLALIQNGDVLQIDLRACRIDLLVSDDDLAQRKVTAVSDMPAPQTYWQALYQQEVTELSEGATFKTMPSFSNLVSKTPRNSH
ncbi:IlvD/Edd family dehydratase [Kordiimonas aquimaris]|uniref:IlvD/Edd family dehydratase n=1 Tax=Kordiimonas aquimaris TaxID=707591 RepID=UPI0021D3653C|nr:IlvD/Edd family dehydratase [Kordiimonas aquimaris]